MGKLENKVAVVTGASGGLGRAIAIGYATEGSKVVCASRKKEPPEAEPFFPGVSTVDYIRNNGGIAEFFSCDVTKMENVEALIQYAVQTFGRLDVIVNNAGVFTKLAPIHELDDYDWDQTMLVNGKGVFNGCRQAVQQFIKQGGGGVIVNVSSIGGLVGLANETCYCASKGAVANMTRAIAVDYGKHNIRVNALCPGFSPTAMTAKSYANDSRRSFIEGLTPLGRWMDAREIVGPAVFLASDDSSYVTGHMLAVDGGYTIM